MSTKSWNLKRTVQCKKCPWKVGVNPHDIPNGYCETKHANLSSTIAESGSLPDLNKPLSAMACHETDDAHCIGWLDHQLGRGNNIGLRLHMMNCSNSNQIRTIGEQHESFEDTLPKG